MVGTPCSVVVELWEGVEGQGVSMVTICDLWVSLFGLGVPSRHDIVNYERRRANSRTEAMMVSRDVAFIR